MAKPYEIRLRVEEIALGGVLRKLHEMPGVMDVDLDLGQGGTGPGSKKLQEASLAQQPGTHAARIVELLSKSGSMHTHEIMKALGIPKGSLASAIYKLSSDGVLERVAFGTYKLSEAAAQAAQRAPEKLLALPAPTKKVAPASPGKRQTRGTGQSVLLGVLAAATAPLPTGELKTTAGSLGINVRSLEGIMHRAVRDKLIKRENKHVTITEKGRKLVATAATAQAPQAMNGAAQHHG